MTHNKKIKNLEKNIFSISILILIFFQKISVDIPLFATFQKIIHLPDRFGLVIQRIQSFARWQKTSTF